MVYAAKLWVKDSCRKMIAEIDHQLIFGDDYWRRYDDGRTQLKWDKLTGDCKDVIRICEEQPEAWDRRTQTMIFDALTAAVNALCTAIWERW